MTDKTVIRNRRCFGPPPDADRNTDAVQLQVFANRFNQRDELPFIGFPVDNHKLVSSDAVCLVTERTVNMVGGSDYQLVAGFVAEAVVFFFQSVEIEIGNSQRK